MKNLIIALVITNLFLFGCCPKQTNENVLEMTPTPPPKSFGWNKDRDIFSKSVFVNDEITRSEESDSFLIVDLKPRDIGSSPTPRRRLNQKKYVSIRAKGGDTQ